MACGLAWKVSAPDALLDDTMEVARKIGAMPVDSLQTTKRLMVAARLDAVRAARAREDAEFVRMVGSEENQAALAQFFSLTDVEGLGEVGEEVVGVLEADGHADEAVGDAELGALGGREAAGDRGRVGEQRLGAAERQGDAGEPAALDERRSCRPRRPPPRR